MSLIGSFLNPLIGFGGTLMRPFLPAPFGPALLADFDYRVALSSWKAGFTGFSSPNATDEWLLQDAASPYANNVGSETLANDTGLVNQTSPDIHDGAVYGNRKCWEATSGSDSLVASGTTAGQSDDVDFAFRIVFRAPVALVVNDHLISNRDSAAGFVGWSVHNASSSIFRITVDDGANAVVSDSTASNISDGALHYLAGWYDKSADIMYLKTDQGAETSTSTAAVTGSLASGKPLTVNSLTGAAATDGNQKMQYAYVGVCVGANSQAMYDEDFWQHATDPAPTKQTTTSRNSLISGEVAPGFVGHFSGGVTPATCQLPITYSAALEAGAGGLGLYCNTAQVNLVPNSRLSTGATGATTNTDNFADAADGFRAAAKSVATASPDFIGKTEVVVAATEYTGSVFLKEDTVGVVGRVYAFDLTNVAEIAGSSVAFTADGTWEQRIKSTFTTPALCVSVSFRVEITNNTESVLHDFWQLELGDGAGAIINTAGGSSALVFCDYAATAGAGVMCKSIQGELEATWVNSYATSPNLASYIVDISNGANNNNRIALLVENGGDEPKGYVANSAGAFESVLSCGVQDTDGQENTVVLRWDSTGGLALGGGEDGQILYNGVQRAIDVGSYTAADLTTDVQIGQFRAPEALAPDAHIARIRIWDGERA